MRRIDTVEAARDLARLLNSAGRFRPVAVVSTPAGRQDSHIDARELADQVGDVVDVYVISTGPESWAFSEEMPRGTQVYGGAGRVYPVPLDWVADPWRSPLRFAFDSSEGRRATEELISDALGMANAAGLIGRSAAGRTTTVTGEVKGFATLDRAVVRTTAGFATVLPELTVPGLPLQHVLAPGMQVTGRLDAHNRLDVTGMLLPAEEALAGYQVFDVVLARVEEVRADSAVLSLHPEVRVDVDRADVTSNELDDLTALMTPGEVLRARVRARGPGWRLTLADLDDAEEARPAACLIEGGPPWLVEQPLDSSPYAEPRTASTAVEDAALAGASPVDTTEADPANPANPAGESDGPPPPSPLHMRPRPGSSAARRPPSHPQPRRPAPPVPPSLPGPGPGSPLAPRPAPPPLGRIHDELRAARDSERRLRDEVKALREERDLLADQNMDLRRRLELADTERRRLRTDLRRSKNRASSTPARTAEWFVDPEEQFRYDVHAAWVRRTPAAEKAARALPEYSIGPEFLASVGELHGIDPQKVADVVFEILTGRAKELPGRDLHRLRVGEGGDAPYRVRESDGAVAWRVALQVNAPSARRLHYWELPGGRIELARVGLHDDLRM